MKFAKQSYDITVLIISSNCLTLNLYKSCTLYPQNLLILYWTIRSNNDIITKSMAATSFLTSKHIKRGKHIMEKNELTRMVASYVETAEENHVQAQDAIEPRLIGMRIFKAPLIAFGSADDPLFAQMQQPQAVGPHFMLPHEWLPEVHTVISCFFPFTEQVKASMRKTATLPTAEWLHARIEGQAFLNTFACWLRTQLEQTGSKSLVPTQDERFHVGSPIPGGTYFTSNWSERHVGFVCGLGTFGICAGLITSNGMAGRLCSVITEAYFEPDGRAYHDVYEYCIRCGACVHRCPVGAVTLESGKNHPPCSAWLNEMKKRFAPRYACGFCQTGVPCESHIPLPR